MPNALIRSASDKWAPVPSSWVASTVTALNSFIVPTSAHATGYIYKATSITSDDKTGSTEPSWPTVLGNTVADNHVTWTCYTTVYITSAEFEAFDANLQAGINGVDGSTHSPASPIIIGGSGLQVTGPTGVSRGGTVTVTTAGAIVLDGGFTAWSATAIFREGTVIVPTALNGRRYLCTTPGVSGSSQPTWPTAYTATVQDGTAVWTCLGPDGDYPQYGPTHVARSRTMVHSLATGRTAVPGTWRVRNIDCAVQSVAPMMDVSDGNGPRPARWMVSLRMHDAATVSQVSVSLRVGWPHSSLPTTMPGARLLRIPTSGIPQAMTSAAAGADGAGYVYLPKPPSADVWTGQQTLVIPCDQANVVDVANYTYVLDIIEEQWPAGSSYPWSLVMKQPVVAATAGIGGGPGLVTIDGITLVDGNRVLVKDSPSFNGDGISIAHSGTWTIAPDLTSPSDFTQGMIVPVAYGGTVNGMTYWQAQTAKTSWAGSSSALTSDAITFLARGRDDDETSVNTQTAFFCHGNIWQSAAVQFTGITEQSFQ